MAWFESKASKKADKNVIEENQKETPFYLPDRQKLNSLAIQYLGENAYNGNSYYSG